MLLYVAILPLMSSTNVLAADTKGFLPAVNILLLGNSSISSSSCDKDLILNPADPLDYAKAIGMCKGVLSAEWLKPDRTNVPNPLGRGILSGFGSNVNPQEGAKLLAISTGTARDKDDPGYMSPDLGYDAGYTSGVPLGFPKERPSCPAVVHGVAHDGIGLRVSLSVPLSATGFSFDVKFYFADYPQFLCSEFNDFSVVIMTPIPAGQGDGNIVYDSQRLPIDVNSNFVEVCQGCALGINDLVGTGFENHGGTGWLEVKAPVQPGSTIELFFVTWDSGDGSYDSTTLIDNFRWINYSGGIVTALKPNPL
jgi:hypothetical protein